MKFIILISIFILSSNARADDIAIFTANENDMAAFDKILANSKQESAVGKSANSTVNTKFSETVRDEVDKLKNEKVGGDASSWAQDQRRRDKESGNTSLGDGNSGGSEAKQLHEANELVRERHSPKLKVKKKND